jgi:mannosyl-3-phosphoglycerate phosphatase
MTPCYAYCMMKIVYTDLDGTLLDYNTYSFKSAEPALNQLRFHRIPLILVTSKTRSETELWRTKMGNRHPFIVENGGAVSIPRAYFPSPVQSGKPRDGYDLIELGEPYESLVAALLMASRRSRCKVKGFHEMTVEEVSALCCIPMEQAAAAKRREYGEPFEILDSEKEQFLLKAIEEQGKQWSRGGRFYHILGRNSKAVAVQILNDLYRQLDPQIYTIGLGDSFNDLPFLRLVDAPILIRSNHSEKIISNIPTARLSTKPGPEGWNDAILEMISAGD